jgi:hypothetical protein
MKTVFEKNVFMPHELLRAQVNVDNSDCKLDCVEVEMDIYLDMKMNIGHHHYSHKESLKGAHDKKKGPKAGEKDWQKEMVVDLSHIKYDAIKDKKAKDGTRRPMSLDDQFMMSQLQPATRHAKHFSARYYSSVETKFDGCTCCNETPDAKVPMTIVPVVNPNSFGFAPPSNGWAPYVFGTKIYPHIA